MANFNNTGSRFPNVEYYSCMDTQLPNEIRRGKAIPYSTLILPLINYIEMIIGFSIIGFVWNLEFKEKFAGLQDSALFTIGTMISIGYWVEFRTCGVVVMGVVRLRGSDWTPLLDSYCRKGLKLF